MKTVLGQATVLLLAALILRAATLGDPNLHIDEAFYFAVGQAMHHGAVPYVDIWDRKPLGLFAIYWAIAAFSDNVLAYQLVALVFATATAFTLTRIARRWSSPSGALLAGIGYLAMLNALGGMGGQSPVFYNLLMAGAALCLVRGWFKCSLARFRRLHLMAMVLCGLAITIKQTTLFEGLWFGLLGLWWLRRHGAGWPELLRHALFAAAIATLPTAAIAGWYAAHGWWPQWFNAMVTSTLRRQPLDPEATRHNIVAIGRLLAVYGGCAGFGLFASWNDPATRRWRWFFLAWLGVAMAALVATPNLFDHYALPLLLPLSILAAPAFSRGWIGRVLFAAVLVVAIILGRAFDFAPHRASRANFAMMQQVIKDHSTRGSMLLLHGPPLLYPTTGIKPLSPLVFTEHLTNDLESNVSLIPTKPEVERILGLRPQIVVKSTRYDLPSQDGRIEEIERYVSDNCREVWRGLSFEPKDISKVEIIYVCR